MNNKSELWIIVPSHINNWDCCWHVNMKQTWTLIYDSLEKCCVIYQNPFLHLHDEFHFLLIVPKLQGILDNIFKHPNTPYLLVTVCTPHFHRTAVVTVCVCVCARLYVLSVFAVHATSRHSNMPTLMNTSSVVCQAIMPYRQDFPPLTPREKDRAVF